MAALRKEEKNKISEDVVKKVSDYVLATGFQINQVGRSLRTGKSMIIGMLMEDINNLFFSTIASLVEMELNKLGYILLISSTKNDSKIESNANEIFKNLQIDGYIIAPTPCGEDMVKGLVQSRIPLVLFDRHFPFFDTDNVVVENEN